MLPQNACGVGQNTCGVGVGFVYMGREEGQAMLPQNACGVGQNTCGVCSYEKVDQVGAM
jgi:hypothetical protein